MWHDHGTSACTCLLTDAWCWDVDLILSCCRQLAVSDVDDASRIAAREDAWQAEVAQEQLECQLEEQQRRVSDCSLRERLASEGKGG